MCSAPSSSMICVPEAALLPIAPRPVRRENSLTMACGKPSGNVGKGRSGTTPIISQCPVTESFPAEASAIRPYAPCAAPGPAAAGGGIGPIFAILSKPRRRSVGTASGTRRAMLPTVSLPWSPYAAASGSSPIPTLSITITIARRNGALLVREVIGHRFRRLDAGDRVLEDHVVGARLIEHERKAIAGLD